MQVTRRGVQWRHLSRLCLIAVAAGVSAVSSSCKAPGQPPPPPGRGNVPFQGTIPAWFYRLETKAVWNYASAISGDGKSVSGEMDLGDTGGQHAHGVRWDRLSDYPPPQWSMTPLPFPVRGATNNFAAAISANGKFVAGDCTAPDGTKTAAYISVNGVSFDMPYLEKLPHEQTEGRAVDNQGMVVGHTGLVAGEYDIDRSEPAVITLWTESNGSRIPTALVSVSEVPSSKAYGVTSDGTCIVGGGASSKALHQYPLGLASGALAAPGATSRATPPH